MPDTTRHQRLGSRSGLNHGRGASQGFTLIEILVTLAIFVVIAIIGWSSLQQYLPRYRTVASAKSLRSDLMRLRNISIRTNRETRIVLTTSGGDCDSVDGQAGAWRLKVGDQSTGSTSWDVLPEDSFDDGSDDDQSEGVVDIGQDGTRPARRVCLADWGSLAGPGSGNEDAIVFSPRGWVANPGADFDGSGTIQLRLVNLIADANGVDDSIAVRVSRAGMVRLVSTLGAEDSSSSGTASSSSAP